MRTVIATREIPIHGRMYLILFMEEEKLGTGYLRWCSDHDCRALEHEAKCKSPTKLYRFRPTRWLSYLFPSITKEQAMALAITEIELLGSKPLKKPPESSVTLTEDMQVLYAQLTRTHGTKED